MLGYSHGCNTTVQLNERFNLPESWCLADCCLTWVLFQVYSRRGQVYKRIKVALELTSSCSTSGICRVGLVTNLDMTGPSIIMWGIYTTGDTSWKPGITPVFLWGSCFSKLSVLWTIVFPPLLVIVCPPIYVLRLPHWYLQTCFKYYDSSLGYTFVIYYSRNWWKP